MTLNVSTSNVRLFSSNQDRDLYRSLSVPLKGFESFLHKTPSKSFEFSCNQFKAAGQNDTINTKARSWTQAVLTHFAFFYEGKYS